jgi:hypothetical protein
MQIKLIFFFYNPPGIQMVKVIPQGNQEQSTRKILPWFFR